jgi:transposase
LLPNQATGKNKRSNQQMKSHSTLDGVLGLDVAKAEVQAQLRPHQGAVRKLRLCFGNEAEGFAHLDQWLARYGCKKVHAGLEATGAYSQALAHWLYEQGHLVSLLNPRRVKEFARSAGIRNKTDRIDAGLIAGYVLAHGEQCRATLWRPPKRELAQLRALVRRREQVSAMLLEEKNRLDSAAAEVRPSIARIIAVLEEQKSELDKRIAQQIRSHPSLARQEQLLCTIPGIGSLTAAVLLSEMAGPDQVRRARQAAALAGLSPRREESGTSVRRNKGIGKAGNRHLRKALYMPALVAIKHNLTLRRFAQRLSAAGKCKMAVICAVMRKLLHIAFGVLKHQEPFNPSLA